MTFGWSDSERRAAATAAALEDATEDLKIAHADLAELQRQVARAQELQKGAESQAAHFLAQREHLSACLARMADLRDAAEAALRETGPGPLVPKHQYANVCKQREEAFARAKAAEARVKTAEEALEAVAVALESTRWYPDSNLLEWPQMPDGLNHGRVMLGLNTARAALAQKETP